MNLKELYQEIILEHGKNPRNLRKTENFNKDAKGNNPLCGDNVHVFLKLNNQRKVEDISFEGSGCAISMASASIMTDLIKGKSDNEAKEIIDDFLGMIKENPELKSTILEEDDISSSSKIVDFNSGFSFIIPRKSSMISFASLSLLPLIKSVIIEAEAIDIAQPLPSKEISSTFL